ncbi:MAG: hypothetical protein PHX68_04940 [Alphaproteobacteria bacterium]|nr:hypothetical protein [Alphaproteobacteria bacterium]
MNSISITQKPELSLWEKIKTAAPWTIGTGLVVGLAAGYAAWVIAAAAVLYYTGYATLLAVTQPVAYAAAAYITYKAAKTAGKIAVSRAEDKLSQQTHQKTMSDIDTYIGKKITERRGREAVQRRETERDRKARQAEWTRQNSDRSRQAARPKRTRKGPVFKRADNDRDMAA